MSYVYYPGCALKSLGRAYEESLLAVFDVLNMHLKELPDWNCCGATAYMAIDESKSFALSARNLALAGRQRSGDEMVHLIAPCNACYLALTKTQRYIEEYDDVSREIRTALEAGRMQYENKVSVRHPLDVLVNDIGLNAVAEQIRRPLSGLKVACYYGCQIVRPYATFDDQHDPVTMEQLMLASGAEAVDWPLKTRCCGGSLTGTIQDVGLRLNYILLKEAEKCGADVIATTCPLCQFNLECYQPRIRRQFKDTVRMPVVYFSQLMGLAFGIPERKLGMHRLFVPLRLKPAAKAMEGGQYVHS